MWREPLNGKILCISDDYDCVLVQDESKSKSKPKLHLAALYGKHVDIDLPNVCGSFMENRDVVLVDDNQKTFIYSVMLKQLESTDIYEKLAHLGMPIRFISVKSKRKTHTLGVFQKAIVTLDDFKDIQQQIIRFGNEDHIQDAKYIPQCECIIVEHMNHQHKTILSVITKDGMPTRLADDKTSISWSIVENQLFILSGGNLRRWSIIKSRFSGDNIPCRGFFVVPNHSDKLVVLNLSNEFVEMSISHP